VCVCVCVCVTIFSTVVHVSVKQQVSVPSSGPALLLLTDMRFTHALGTR
jgi:hypothetical protein